MRTILTIAFMIATVQVGRADPMPMCQSYGDHMEPMPCDSTPIKVTTPPWMKTTTTGPSTESFTIGPGWCSYDYHPPVGNTMFSSQMGIVSALACHPAAFGDSQ